MTGLRISDGPRPEPAGDVDSEDPRPPFAPATLADPWRLAARLGVRQPSQATITFLGDIVLKSAEGQAAVKLRAQADWIEAARALGYRHAPTILERREETGSDGALRFAFAMPRYRPLVEPGPEVAVAILRALGDLWRLPASGILPIRPRSYARAVAAGLVRLCTDTAEFLLRTSDRLEWPQTAPALIHGDPTFENTVRDSDGRIVLLDPNVQRFPAICLPEQDIAKVALSCAGWEDFVAARIDLIAPHPTGELVPLEGLSGYSPRLVRWLAAAHLARTIPYGAKRGDGRLVLPSIRAWLSGLDQS